jgi:hypothetical protein
MDLLRGRLDGHGDLPAGRRQALVAPTAQSQSDRRDIRRALSGPPVTDACLAVSAAAPCAQYIQIGACWSVDGAVWWRPAKVSVQTA